MVVPPIFIIGGRAAGLLEAAAMPAGKPEPPEDAAQQRKRAIRAAIRDRDLAAFLKLMPSDPAERRVLLRETYALASAFRASSLPIVRQILEWDRLPVTTVFRKHDGFDAGSNRGSDTVPHVVQIPEFKCQA